MKFIVLIIMSVTETKRLSRKKSWEKLWISEYFQIKGLGYHGDIECCDGGR